MTGKEKLSETNVADRCLMGALFTALEASLGSDVAFCRLGPVSGRVVDEEAIETLKEFMRGDQAAIINIGEQTITRIPPPPSPFRNKPGV